MQDALPWQPRTVSCALKTLVRIALELALKFKRILKRFEQVSAEIAPKFFSVQSSVYNFQKETIIQVG